MLVPSTTLVQVKSGQTILQVAVAYQDPKCEYHKNTFVFLVQYTKDRSKVIRHTNSVGQKLVEYDCKQDIIQFGMPQSDIVIAPVLSTNQIMIINLKEQSYKMTSFEFCGPKGRFEMVVLSNPRIICLKEFSNLKQQKVWSIQQMQGPLRLTFLGLNQGSQLVKIRQQSFKEIKFIDFAINKVSNDQIMLLRRREDKVITFNRYEFEDRGVYFSIQIKPGQLPSEFPLSNDAYIWKSSAFQWFWVVPYKGEYSHLNLTDKRVVQYKINSQTGQTIPLGLIQKYIIAKRQYQIIVYDCEQRKIIYSRDDYICHRHQLQKCNYDSQVFIQWVYNFDKDQEVLEIKVNHMLTAKDFFMHMLLFYENEPEQFSEGFDDDLLLDAMELLPQI